MEIYNEVVNDLLSDPKSRPLGGLKVKAGEGGVVFVDGIEAQVGSPYLLKYFALNPFRNLWVEWPQVNQVNWQFLSGGEHEGGDLCADEERGGEQAHRQDQDERPQQSLPHNIQVYKFLEDINRLI